MNKLLLLTPLFFFQTIHPQVNRPQLEALADKAYSTFIASAKTQDEKAIEAFIESAEFVALQASLEQALEADDSVTRKQIMEPVVIFAQRLKARCADKDQMIKDWSAQDARAIEQITFGTLNNYAYFEMLKVYGFEQAFLYTLGELSTTQKEIVELAIHVRDALWPVLASQSVEEIKEREQRSIQEIETIKQSPLIEQLKAELTHANTLKNSWVEAENVAANIRFFIHMLELHLTDKVTFFKKYTIADAEQKAHIVWLFEHFNAQQIFSTLGF